MPDNEPEYNPSRLQARYRNQSWWVRRWRDRYLLLVPIWTLLMWLGTRSRKALSNPKKYVTRMRMVDCWDVALGIADSKRENWLTPKEAGMDWIYDYEETRDD